MLGSLASNAIEEGRVHDGQILVRQGLLIQRDLDDRVELAVNLSHAAETLVAMGRPSPCSAIDRRLSGAVRGARWQLSLG